MLGMLNTDKRDPDGVDFETKSSHFLVSHAEKVGMALTGDETRNTCAAGSTVFSYMQI